MMLKYCTTLESSRGSYGVSSHGPGLPRWMIVKGNPSMAGAFGALYGEGDTRASAGINFQYLQNLELGLSYAFFLGDPNKLIGNSPLHANPYADRDYASFHIKYQF